MEYRNIALTHEGNVALLCLNRPEALNALDQVMQYEQTVFLDCMRTEEHQAVFRELMNKKKSEKD
jgi:enoyl-CoA hydratase/carnithine racemase